MQSGIAIQHTYDETPTSTSSNKNQLSLSAAINYSVESSLCEQFIPM